MLQAWKADIPPRDSKLPYPLEKAPLYRGAFFVGEWLLGKVLLTTLASAEPTF
jgi:hypothetical protein